jgi:hypothetical protein
MSGTGRRQPFRSRGCWRGYRLGEAERWQEFWRRGRGGGSRRSRRGAGARGRNRWWPARRTSARRPACGIFCATDSRFKSRLNLWRARGRPNRSYRIHADLERDLDRIAGNGVRTIIVESPDRFARDLAVHLAGHDFLKNLGVALIPATAPDFFLEDTPTAVLQGYTAASGEPCAAMSVRGMLRGRHSPEAPLHAGEGGGGNAASPTPFSGAQPPPRHLRANAESSATLSGCRD